MAGHTKREIRDQDVQGLKCLRKIRPLLSRLRKVGPERDRAGNRRLFMDQYCSLILIYTGEKPNRAMYQMVWYYLIGLASLKELEAFIKSRKQPVSAEPWPHQHTGFAAARSVAYEPCSIESREARGCPYH